MSDADDEFSGFDIGVEQVSPPSASRNRALPTWALIVLALALGWLLGVVTSGAQSSEEIAAEPPTVEPVPTAESSPGVEPDRDPVATPSTATGEPAAIEPAEPASSSERVAVVLLEAPLRGVAIPADLSVIEQGVTTPIAVDLMISGATSSWVGRGARRILVADHHVVFMALDAVMMFDPLNKSEPIEVATDAIHLLPGPDDASVWLVGSGSRSVRLYSVASGEVSETFDLSDIGAPLASYAGGLVVAPKDASAGTLAVWSPSEGMTSLGIDADYSFVDAGGNRLVLAGPQGIATHDIVTGELRDTGRFIERTQQHRAIVSPDGRRLAIVERLIITELPMVVVIDTLTGATLDAFETAFEWQLQWVSADELLFALPQGRSVQLNVRDTTTKTSEEVADLSSPNYLVTTVQEFGS